MPIRKLLIANRGEIAVRIARTCREMGIASVAVRSDADRNAVHARAAGEAVDIGPSYLDIERILDAAQRTGAEAIHPGYGFLAESAAFADACAQENLIFIGPSAATIRALGLKTGARDIALRAGVPVLPSYTPGGPLDFPVLIKASAGGGGRGMRVVHDATGLPAALEAARSEAQRSFGDGELLIEKYLAGARHIEFQIFGDRHGNVIQLYERDCSIQRRYQKLIEESPSPGFKPALNDDLRKRMGEAAVAIGRAANYVNAGTVEFLLAPSGEFYFLEVNTRIQVEHPVTELVTGLDLIRLQIEVAEGRALPPRPAASGHAIEARLNAEDPAQSFVPSTGRVHVWRPPKHVRVDTALEEGTEIGIHYDSLLAKIVSHAHDRASALRQLIEALRSTAILGLRTNREYLIQLLESAEFREGRAHTGFLPPCDPPRANPLPYAAAAILHTELTRQRLLPGVPPNFRNNPFRPPSAKLMLDDHALTVEWKRLAPTEYAVRIDAAEFEPMRVAAVDPASIRLAIEGVERAYEIKTSGDMVFVWSSRAAFEFRRVPRHPRPAASTDRATANSPMPGQVLRILVQEGQNVAQGDALVVLEAMKMEQTIRTTINGVVSAILVQPGQVVAPGQMLVQISAMENPQ